MTTFLFPILLALFSISILLFLTSHIKNKSKANLHAINARKKRLERDNQIKQLILPTINISKQLEDKILNSDATTLLELLKNGEITSEQLLIIYFKRAITIGLDLELITEINFDDALAQARQCDKLRKENPSACSGILFGLPMSIKDVIILKGKSATGGVACGLSDPAIEDGYLVKVLKGEGAIPYVMSNVPQGLMTFSCTNRIWGTAKNPWNTERTAGGSSGGEAALIAARCSPLGIGSDIAGSVRIPAAMNGVVGFKPTAERVTTMGNIPEDPAFAGLLNIKVVMGPIVKSVRDVNLLMKALLNGQAHKTMKLTEKDPHYARKEWQEDIVNKKQKMRIGYFKNIEFLPATLANQRAVDEAVQAFRNRGYDLVEVEFPNIEDVIFAYMEVIGSEKDFQFLPSLQGEPPISDYKMLRLRGLLPNWVRKPLKVLLNLYGEERMGRIFEATKGHTAYEFLSLVGRQAEVRKEFFKTWEQHNLDAIMLPSFAYPAHKIALDVDLIETCYTHILNLLDLPSGHVPVTVVKEGEDVYPRENSKYHDMIYRKIVKSMEGSVGLPVGVQIATLPWEDEKCVGVMLELEEEMQFVKKHPYPM